MLAPAHQRRAAPPGMARLLPGRAQGAGAWPPITVSPVREIANPVPVPPPNIELKRPTGANLSGENANSILK